MKNNDDVLRKLPICIQHQLKLYKRRYMELRFWPPSISKDCAYNSVTSEVYGYLEALVNMNVILPDKCRDIKLWITTK